MWKKPHLLNNTQQQELKQKPAVTCLCALAIPWSDIICSQMWYIYIILHWHHLISHPITETSHDQNHWLGKNLLNQKWEVSRKKGQYTYHSLNFSLFFLPPLLSFLFFSFAFFFFFFPSLFFFLSNLSLQQMSVCPKGHGIPESLKLLKIIQQSSMTCRLSHSACYHVREDSKNKQKRDQRETEKQYWKYTGMHVLLVVHVVTLQLSHVTFKGWYVFFGNGPLRTNLKDITWRCWQKLYT